MISSVIFTLPLLTFAVAMDNLTVAFRWRQLEFEYPTESDKWQDFLDQKFIPEHNMPLGVEVYGDRLFLTLPKWKKQGIPVSLAYIKLTDEMNSPKLHPYPNWDAHDKPEPDVISAYRARADICGRLWVLDTGLVDILSGQPKPLVSPRFVVYNLTTDEVIFSYTVPSAQFDSRHSFFVNIAVEENNCDDSFAYLADFGRPALVVYDLARNKSWVVKHHYFNVDPLAGALNVSGIEFSWSEGLTGLALSGKNPDGYSTLYFHPISSFNEFNVSTRVLQDETLATDSEANFKHFKVLGTRGPKAQSGASFFHRKSNVLFYALVNLNAVACWRTTLANYDMKSQGRVFMSNDTMVFPSDIKVDGADTIWVLSNKLPVFYYGRMDFREYNFRILKSTVAHAITGTTCDSKMKVLRNVTRSGGKNGAGGAELGLVLLVVTFVGVAFG